jgi:hypothetical protein
MRVLCVDIVKNEKGRRQYKKMHLLVSFISKCLDTSRTGVSGIVVESKLALK